MLDGGQMNLFRKLARRPETKKIQTVTENEVQEVLQYMEGLPLPHPNKTLKLELLDGRNLTRRCRPAVKAQWYLLVFDEEGQGAFNAGYVLKQGQELLRARRIATKILRQIPEEAADAIVLELWRSVRSMCLLLMSDGRKRSIFSFVRRAKSAGLKKFLPHQEKC